MATSGSMGLKTICHGRDGEEALAKFDKGREENLQLIDSVYRSAAAFSKIGSATRGWSNDVVNNFKEMCTSQRMWGSE